MTTRPAIHLDGIDWASAVRRAVYVDAGVAYSEAAEALAARVAALLRDQFGMVEEGGMPLDHLASSLIAHLNQEVDRSFRGVLAVPERLRIVRNVAAMIHGAVAVYASSRVAPADPGR